jgi:hypothetical protein
MLKGHSHRFSRNSLFFTMHNSYISDYKTKCLCYIRQVKKEIQASDALSPHEDPG